MSNIELICICIRSFSMLHVSRSALLYASLILLCTNSRSKYRISALRLLISESMLAESEHALICSIKCNYSFSTCCTHVNSSDSSSSPNFIFSSSTFSRSAVIAPSRGESIAHSRNVYPNEIGRESETSATFDSCALPPSAGISMDSSVFSSCFSGEVFSGRLIYIGSSGNSGLGFDVRPRLPGL